jgi:hypothetical protein
LAERAIKLVKRQEREKKLASSEEMCVKISEDELRRKWNELRRAYLAFEKFVNELIPE